MRRVVLAVVVAILGLGLALALVWAAGRSGDAVTTMPPPSAAAGEPAGVTSSVLDPPPVLTARILVQTPFRADAGDEAPILVDEFGENELVASVGRQVTVVERLRAPDSEWARVYVHVDPFEWPGDFFAWLPMEIDGMPVLELEPARACPPRLTLETIAALSPFERVACASDQPITLDVRSGFASGYVAYRTEPAFFGSAHAVVGGRSLGPITDRMVLEPIGFGLPAFDAWPAPGVEPPPLDVDVRVTGTFAHRRAAACRRTRDGPAGPGLPDEAVPDSIAWCRTRFVITGWQILRGPERRPWVPGDVQLHRGVPGGACAGVGMEGPLTLRIDPGRPDAVWVEGPGGGRSLALFPDAVRYQSLPGPSLVTATGLVLRDGATFDPDVGFPGLPSCPGGSVISFGS